MSPDPGIGLGPSDHERRVTTSGKSPRKSSSALYKRQDSACQPLAETDQILDRPHTSWSRSERELPGYLVDLTRLRRNASKFAKTIDARWPQFYRPCPERQTGQALLDIGAEGYSHIMPLIQDFYINLTSRVSVAPEEFVELVDSYWPRYLAARGVIEKYNALLRNLSGPRV